MFILNENDIKQEPIKHFENLSYLIPNLNFAASDSRARYFQIRGIGERSGYLGTPNSSVAFLIDDVDYSGQGLVLNNQHHLLRTPPMNLVFLDNQNVHLCL